jgi:hypothetical protein
MKSYKLYTLKINQIGGNKFKAGDRFVTIDGDYGSIIRVASIDEFGTDLMWSVVYYVVNFDNGNKKTYSSAINVSRNGTYNYLVDEQSLVLTTQPMINVMNTTSSMSLLNPFSPLSPLNISVSPNDINKCKFFVGEYVYIQNALLRLTNPLRDELIINKFCRINKKHNLSQFTIPPYKCLYEIIFDNGNIAPEVGEEYITKLNNSLINYINPPNTFNPISSSFIPKSSLPNVSNFNSYIMELIKLNNNYSGYNQLILTSPNYENDYDKKEVKKYYYKALIKVTNKDSKFNKIKELIETRKGKKAVYKLLKKYYNKYASDWKEMKDIDNYDHVMTYLKKNILDVL